MSRKLLGTITEEVCRTGYIEGERCPSCHKALDRAYYGLHAAIGRVLPRDIGKRVYLIDDIIQVENDEQREAREKSWGLDLV